MNSSADSPRRLLTPPPGSLRQPAPPPAAPLVRSLSCASDAPAPRASASSVSESGLAALHQQRAVSPSAASELGAARPRSQSVLSDAAGLPLRRPSGGLSPLEYPFRGRKESPTRGAPPSRWPGGSNPARRALELRRMNMLPPRGENLQKGWFRRPRWKSPEARWRRVTQKVRAAVRITARSADDDDGVEVPPDGGAWGTQAEALAWTLDEEERLCGGGATPPVSPGACSAQSSESGRASPTAAVERLLARADSRVDAALFCTSQADELESKFARGLRVGGEVRSRRDLQASGRNDQGAVVVRTVAAGTRGTVLGAATDGLVRVRFKGDVVLNVGPSGDVTDSAYRFRRTGRIRAVAPLRAGDSVAVSAGDVGAVLGSGRAAGEVLAAFGGRSVSVPAAAVEPAEMHARRREQVEEEAEVRDSIELAAVAHLRTLARAFIASAETEVMPSEVVREAYDEHTAPQSMSVQSWLVTSAPTDPTRRCPHVSRAISRADKRYVRRHGVAGMWYLFGVRCWMGLCMTRDQEAAQRWLTHSSAAGFAPATNMLGVVLWSLGQRDEAIDLLRKAVAAGSAAAAYNLALLAHNEDATSGGAEWVRRTASLWKQAAELDHPVAMLRHAVVLPSWSEERMRWLSRAASFAMPAAELMYADSLCAGDGGRRDLSLAESMYRRAAASGQTEAQYSLACLLLGVWTASCPAPQRQPTLARRDAIVIMDNYANRRLTGEMLRRAGWRVDEAQDGKVAARLCRETRDRGEPFVVMVIDVSYPRGWRAVESPGLQALRIVRYQEVLAAAEPVPAVACVGTESERNTAISRGVTMVIQKPVGPKALASSCTLATERGVQPDAEGLAWPSPSRHQAASPHHAAKQVDEVLRWKGRAREYGAPPSEAEEARGLEAERWLRMAAEAGDAEAANALGFLLTHGGARGHVTDASLQEGAHWYAKAADLGLDAAKHNLSCCLDPSTDSVAGLDPSEGLWWWWAFGMRWQPPTTVVKGSEEAETKRVEEREAVEDSEEEEEVLFRMDPRTPSVATVNTEEALAEITGGSADSSPTKVQRQPVFNWQAADRVYIVTQRRVVEFACTESSTPFPPQYRKSLVRRLGQDAVVLATDQAASTVKLLFGDGETLWAPAGSVRRLTSTQRRRVAAATAHEKDAADRADAAITSLEQDGEINADGVDPELLRMVLTDLIASGFKRESVSSASPERSPQQRALSPPQHRQPHNTPMPQPRTDGRDPDSPLSDRRKTLPAPVPAF